MCAILVHIFDVFCETGCFFNGDWATGTERSEFPIAQSTISSKGIFP